MEVIHRPEVWRDWQRAAERPLGFVPTMGALHDGHLRLLKVARERVCDGSKPGTVAASIFVNPTQFGPGEDWERYPRRLEEDLRLCREAGVDAVFVPDASSMYEPDSSVWVEEERLSRVLCGRSRPGHFRGVCTVVTKLLMLTQPEVLLLGEKDWQQLVILRRMVRELFIPVEVVGVPTVREADGLALSSRNRYLDREARAAAPKIYGALCEICRLAGEGERRGGVLRERLRGLLEAIPGARVDYAEVADAETFEPLEELEGRSVRAFVAVHLGGARLIDNVALPTGVGSGIGG